ncbi:MAG: threonine aldolase [Candidatus Poribacteria bacterium]|nr:MAG: threonine aldolase [Candidatus Poribacteria bacterium]
MNPIDLRSDTVTRPTPAMRQAMAEAEVGDDCYGEDPTVNRLEQTAAEIMGKEAALFVPSGTMGNLTALLTHTRPGEALLLDAESHIYYYEQGGLAAFAGLLPVFWDTPNGCPSPDFVRSMLHRNPRMYPPVGLVALENTHNRRGGCVITPEEIAAVHAVTQEAGVPLHLDGARIFNAAVALGIHVREIARHVETLSFCLSKGLGAPVGSLLAGPAVFIDRARRVRRRLGGAMRQAGVLAAAGLIALTEMPKRLHEDHENARLLARRLAEIPELGVQPERVQTNILVVRTERLGISAEEVAARLRERGVLVTVYGPTTIRFVTHHDVSREQVLLAAERAVALFRELLSSRSG